MWKTPCVLIQFTFQQPIIKQISQFSIIQILHQEMRIAIDADFRKFY